MSNLKPNLNLVEPEPEGECNEEPKAKPKTKGEPKGELEGDPKGKNFLRFNFFTEKKFKFKKKTHNTNKLNVVYKLNALYLFMLFMN